MTKKLLTTLTIAIVIFSAIFIGQVSSEKINHPVNLKLTISPPSVPSDNTTSACIFVQLQDADGLPARAASDTVISLSSSSTEIGSVDAALTIKACDTYAVANFSSTFSPGSTVITAAATGYETVQSPITTIGPKPYTVAVYGFPAALPADGQTYRAIMVQLQDSTGSPAKAPCGGTKVTLSCSDTIVGDVTPSVTILEGQTYAVASFTTTLDNGAAVITPVASDYTSKSAKIVTTTISSSQALTISTGPAKVLADNVAYSQIVVQLRNESGYLGLAPHDLTVTIASNDQSIGVTEQQIVIPAGQNYALATFSTTYKAGTAVLTAAATGYIAATQTLTTTGYTASKLAVYCTPSWLPSDSGVYQTVQVQLQDAQGRPAKAPSNLTVSLFSSQPSVASVSSSLTMAMGQTCTSGALTVTKTAGQVTITAQASSYVTAQATMETSKIDLMPISLTVAANSKSIYFTNTSEVTVYVLADGLPLAGANVVFTSNGNGSFAATRDEGAGYYKANYIAPANSSLSAVTVTVNVSADGCLSASATTRITVTAPPAPVANQTANSTATVLVLRVLDFNGDPVSDAQVSTATQPAGLGQLSGVTNASGYVTFRGVKAGYYAFDVTKEGYSALSAGVNFKGTPVTFMLTQTPADNTLTIIAPIIAVVLIVAIVVTVVKRRRKGGSNALQPLNWPMPS